MTRYLLSASTSNFLDAYNNSTVNVSGSIGNYLDASDSSVVTIFGGSIGSTLYASNKSNVTVVSGIISGPLYADNTSTVTISGGNIGRGLYAFNNSVVNVSGGSVSHAFFVGDNSTVNVFGGTFGQEDGVNFVDMTKGAFTLIGSNLMANNARADTNFGGTDYDLSGTLQGGTNLNGYVINVTPGSTFTLRNAPVPEVSTLVALPVLLATMGAGLARKRRSRS